LRKLHHPDLLRLAHFDFRAVAFSIFSLGFKALLHKKSGLSDGAKDHHTVFQSYKYVESEKAWGSTMGAYHKWAIDGNNVKLAEGDRGDFVADKAVVDGSVPPFLVVWALCSHPYTKRAEQWFKAYREYNEFASVEGLRREKCKKQSEMDCGICKSSYPSRDKCYNCGWFQCRGSHSSSHHNSARCPVCDAWSDSYRAEPNDAWVKDMKEKLERKYKTRM